LFYGFKLTLERKNKQVLNLKMSIASQSNLDSTVLKNNCNITDLNHNLVNNESDEDQNKENHVKCK